MTSYVITPDVAIHLAQSRVAVRAEHRILAPTLQRVAWRIGPYISGPGRGYRDRSGRVRYISGPGRGCCCRGRRGSAVIQERGPGSVLR